MDGRNFLSLADTLVAGSTEAEWRTAVSRAYYAAFHVARQLLSDLGFLVPYADRAHAYLWLRLSNSGNTQVNKAGTNLNDLRRQRNQADYDLNRPMRQVSGHGAIQLTRQTLQILDDGAQEPTRSEITDAIKVYERDVLQDVTWRP